MKVLFPRWNLLVEQPTSCLAIAIIIFENKHFMRILWGGGIRNVLLQFQLTILILEIPLHILQSSIPH